MGIPDDVFVFSVFALGVPPFAVHDRGIDVGRRECVGLVQQRNDTQQNGPETDTTRATMSVAAYIRHVFTLHQQFYL